MHRKRRAPVLVPLFAGTRATEYRCGCIIHPVAGAIRKCGAMPSRSLSGKLVKLEGDPGRHTAGEVKRYYPVANILP